MSIDLNDFDRFVDFGRSRIAQNDVSTLDELVIEWESLRDRKAINAAIREGIADADAGRGRPADEVIADLRRRHAGGV